MANPDPPLATPVHASALDLEAAHAAVRRAALVLELDVEPVIDLAPAARALERALGATYDAIDRRADPVVAVRTALAAVDGAEALIAPACALDAKAAGIGAHLAGARAHFARAEAQLARVPAPPPAEPPDLLASDDLPRLHAVARASLEPALKVRKAPPPPPPPPEPLVLGDAKTFDELHAVIGDMKRKLAPKPSAPAPAPALVAAPPARVRPPGFARDVPPAIGDLAFLRARTRACFEEVAMAGMQRAPLLGDAWRASLGIERRMLASIDVIGAIGAPAIAHVPTLFADAPLRDSMHAFAVAMILGCFEGRDALAAAEHALLAGERDAAFVDAFGDALALVPHDALPLALRTLRSEADPTLRALAIDVLGYRGLATPDELAAAASDVPQVAARALVHLAHATDLGVADVLDAHASTDDPALRAALWAAMALTNHPRLVGLLEAALDGEDAADAARWLAIAGDEEDARRLTRRALDAKTPALLGAVGWCGDAWAVSQLIDVLGGDADDEAREAAAAALERITGAGLVEPTDVDEDDILVEDPPDPDIGEPRAPRLAATVGDARDAPPEPGREQIDRPSTDPDRWRAYWLDKGVDYDMRARYRRGQPYTPLVSLAELEGATATLAERRLLQRELVIRSGGFVRFDPHDLVVVQEAAIRAWQPIAARASSQPGKWSRPPRRA